MEIHLKVHRFLSLLFKGFKLQFYYVQQFSPPQRLKHSDLIMSQIWPVMVIHVLRGWRQLYRRLGLRVAGMGCGLS